MIGDSPYWGYAQTDYARQMAAAQQQVWQHGQSGLLNVFSMSSAAQARLLANAAARPRRCVPSWSVLTAPMEKVLQHYPATPVAEVD